MLRTVPTVILSALIIALGWWFHILLVPLLLLASGWLSWYYRDKFVVFRQNFKQKHRNIYRTLLGTIILGLGMLTGILIYRFGFELISVPSPSMEKAIHSGDYILVNKLIPGPRRFPEIPDKYFRMAGIG